MSVTGLGDIPLGFDDGLAVHVSVLGTMEPDATNNCYLGSGLGCIGSSWTSVSQSARRRLHEEGRTRKFDEFAAVLGNGKLDAVDYDFIRRH